MDHKRVLDRVLTEIKKDIPKFEVVDKETSSFMKFLNFFLQVFNKTFLTSYYTTIAPKVYVPIGKLDLEASRAWVVMAHEWWHLRQAARLSFPIWAGRYLLPQILTPLALLSLLAIWLGPWWLLNLIWLVMAAPLPAYFRADEEMDAYTMTFCAEYWLTGKVSEYTIERKAEHFYKSNYYFMWPFKDAVLKRMHAEVGKIANGEYDNVFPYSKVKEIIDDERQTNAEDRDR